MNAFAAALAVLHADPNLSVQARYVADPSVSPEVFVRVILASPDEMLAAGQGGAVMPDVTIRVIGADLPNPPDRGCFVVDGRVYEVIAAMQDEVGLSWRVACRRLTEGPRARALLRQASA
jgi:hypothetical protein